MININEVKQHNNAKDCWVIIHNKIYDVTLFLNEHPGGSGIILKYAGKDATKAFDPIHPGDVLTKYLPKECCLGEVDRSGEEKKKKKKSKVPQPKVDNIATNETIKASDNINQAVNINGQQLQVEEFDVEYDEQQDKQPMNYPVLSALAVEPPIQQAYSKKVEDEDDEEDDEDEDDVDEYEIQRRKYEKAKPDIGQVYNLTDFEYIARYTMDKIAWAYYSSGCDDEITMRYNHLAYHKYFFKPKILVDVTKIDLSTYMFGTKVQAPFYITATALGKLGHPEGEIVLTRQAAKQDIIQMIPTLASCSFDEIVDAAIDKQTQWLQLYVNADKSIVEKMLVHAVKRGIKAVMITVDAPQLGRREKDMRSKDFEDTLYVQGSDDDSIDRSQGAARAISSFIDTSLNWSDLAWFKKILGNIPIVLKGVQSVEDSLKAMEYNVNGIILSNHGGRQLEFSKPPIDVLFELNQYMKSHKITKPEGFEIYIDGGIRRASDILKALCLGANGVGIGRPFLYAMSTYGDDGVYKAIQILKDEMIMNMRLLGANNIDDLNDRFIEKGDLRVDDKLFNGVYQPLEHPKFKL